MNGKITRFAGNDYSGQWKTLSLQAISGKPLKQTLFVFVEDEVGILGKNRYSWKLNGCKSNLRYTNRDEKELLNNEPALLPVSMNNLAALIPIKKSEEWWLLAQDERRKIIEEKSKHISTGINYLSGISRQLYHSRDLGEEFDFITWFEFSEKYAASFDQLVEILRNSEEWKYVVRETDIRLIKAG